MIPVNNGGIDSSNLRDRAINIQEELIELNSRKPFVTILLLDCCRTYDFYNPDLNTVALNANTSKSVGLAPICEAGSLVAFACAPRTIADEEKEERNGLFTKHLLKHITTPNQDVRILLADVTKGVQDESESAQIPFLNLSLLKKDIYLCVQPTGKL